MTVTRFVNCLLEVLLRYSLIRTSSLKGRPFILPYCSYVFYGFKTVRYNIEYTSIQADCNNQLLCTCSLFLLNLAILCLSNHLLWQWVSLISARDFFPLTDLFCGDAADQDQYESQTSQRICQRVSVAQNCCCCCCSHSWATITHCCWQLKPNVFSNPTFYKTTFSLGNIAADNAADLIDIVWVLSKRKFYFNMPVFLSR